MCRNLVLTILLAAVFAACAVSDDIPDREGFLEGCTVSAPELMMRAFGIARMNLTVSRLSIRS